MKFNNVIILNLSILFIFFQSCSSEDFQIDNESSLEVTSRNSSERIITSQNNNENSRIVLGAKRENPYSLENINLAGKEFYGENHPNYQATHNYIKFNPSSQDDVNALETWELSTKIPLFDFPIEYEVLSEGAIYVDSDVTDTLFYSLYGAIPLGINLPPVSFVEIEELYLDSSDPFLMAQSYWLTNNRAQINRGIIKGGISVDTLTAIFDDLGGDDEILDFPNIPEIPTNPCPEGFDWALVVDDQPGPNGEIVFFWECQVIVNPPDPELNACNCPIPLNEDIPAGCIRVDFDGEMVPVEIATVKLKGSWFRSELLFISEGGCWRSTDEYDEVKMWVRFINNNVKSRDTRHFVGLKAVQDFVENFELPPYNNILVEYESAVADNTSQERRYWAASHTLNTINQYINQAGGDGIPSPRPDLIWLNRAGNGGAAAPMLQGNYFSSWPAFFAAFYFTTPFSLSVSNLPDIINQYSEGEGANVFTGVGFHELGHASHHSLVGESYWFGYRNHIINNFGYGSFGNFNGNCCAERVALGEAIGNFTGAM